MSLNPYNGFISYLSLDNKQLQNLLTHDLSGQEFKQGLDGLLLSHVIS